MLVGSRNIISSGRTGLIGSFHNSGRPNQFVFRRSTSRSSAAGAGILSLSLSLSLGIGEHVASARSEEEIRERFHCCPMNSTAHDSGEGSIAKMIDRVLEKEFSENKQPKGRGASCSSRRIRLCPP